MSKKKILYLTRDGLLEPLGQSQILSYLAPLSNKFLITIVSFEKKKDIENKLSYSYVKKICDDNNIEWIPLTYRQTFRSLGILMGFVDLILETLRTCNKKNIDCIHARSYYPAFVALLVNRINKIPFIFDMRALWPEELRESGRLKGNGFVWSVIKILEKKCLEHSKAVVSLTNAALEHLDIIHPQLCLKNKTVVIPTCANLERFKLKKRIFDQENITISCVGSILSGWFLVDTLEEVVNYIMENYPNVDFEFLTRDDSQKILSSIDPERKWKNRIKIESISFKDMPKRLSNHDGSVFFFSPNISKLGSAPTRMAELLGTGIPVLTNNGVGDVASIVKNNNVGVIIESENPNIPHACDKFIELVSEKSIDIVCRNTSEKLFSVGIGVKNYSLMYNKAAE